MKNHTCRLSAAALMLMLFALAAAAQSELHDARLPNFHHVNQHLYRGAQPRSGGMQKLAALGIKTIVNLRAADGRAKGEADEARAAGLRYFNVPMGEYARPTDEQIGRVLAIINDPDNQPVFVHCQRGADRTGTVVAIYRITHDGWTSAKAKQEASFYGMRRVQFEMRDYITDYYLRHTTMGHVKAGSHRRTHIAGVASAATRRTLEKSYSYTRKGLKQIRKAVL